MLRACASCSRSPTLWRPGAARNLQDPLSIRCVPQTHGAALRRALGRARDRWRSSSTPPATTRSCSSTRTRSSRSATSTSPRSRWRSTISGSGSRTPPRSPTSGSRSCSGITSAACRPGSRTRTGRPAACGRWVARSRRAASEARFLANPVSLDYRGQLAEGVEDHASMAPLAVSATSSLVSLAHRLVALELIIAAQARRPARRPGPAR